MPNRSRGYPIASSRNRRAESRLGTPTTDAITLNTVSTMAQHCQMALPRWTTTPRCRFRHGTPVLKCLVVMPPNNDRAGDELVFACSRTALTPYDSAPIYDQAIVGRLPAAAVLHPRVFTRANPRSCACPRRACENHGSCARRFVVAASQSVLARSGRAGGEGVSRACQG